MHRLVQYVYYCCKYNGTCTATFNIQLINKVLINDYLLIKNAGTKAKIVDIMGITENNFIFFKLYEVDLHRKRFFCSRDIARKTSQNILIGGEFTV